MGSGGVGHRLPGYHTSHFLGPSLSLHLRHRGRRPTPTDRLFHPVLCLGPAGSLREVGDHQNLIVAGQVIEKAVRRSLSS